MKIVWILHKLKELKLKFFMLTLLILLLLVLNVNALIMEVKITKVCNYNTILLLGKQRFFCKHCNKTFTASTNIVDFHKQISNDTRTSVILDLMTKDSEKNCQKK